MSKNPSMNTGEALSEAVPGHSMCKSVYFFALSSRPQDRNNILAFIVHRHGFNRVISMH